MEKEKIVVILKIHKRNEMFDLEVPLGITANELVIGLNTAFELSIDVTDVKKCYLKCENPIVLLKGNRLLSEFGLRNGTIINYTE